MRSIAPWLALALLTAFPVYSQPVETARDLEVADWVYFGAVGDVTRMGWVPDGSGRLFVTRMSGQVLVVENGVVQPTPFISESFTQGWEQEGLLGMAFDPDFANNHYVYFFAAMPGRTLQIFRYTDVGGVGVNRTIIVDGIPGGVLDYDGGGLTFGPDGMLYFGVGSLYADRVADTLTAASGKIHRVRPDGSVPTDNPFYDGAGPNVDSIWARGFCNLYGLVFQPVTGRLWANASGPGAIQIFSVSPGDHAGWGLYQNNQPAGYLSPVYSYLPGVNDEYWFTPTGAVRQNGVATFTLMDDGYLESYSYRKGTRILIMDVEDPSFNGEFHVTGHPSSRSFTVDQPEPDAVSGGGQLKRWPEGEFSMGGMFYAGTRFPASYSGNYLYTDFRGMLHRIRFATDGSVDTDDIIINRDEAGGGGLVDVNEGPDGALYVLNYYGSILRVTPTPEGQALIVSPSALVIPEGETRTVMVSLAMPPLVDVWVKVAVQGGEGDLTVVEGGSLRFTRENWSVPQFVTLGAAQDADADVEHATFTFTPTQDFPVVTVHARTEEDDVPEEPATDGGMAEDAGSELDAGALEDAGNVEDAGAFEDAGALVDAGAVVDAGSELDAGSAKDGSTVPVHMEDESGGCSAGATALPGVLGWWLLAGLVWRPRRARR